MMDTTTHEMFFDKLTFVYLEMPKFRIVMANMRCSVFSI